MRYIGYRGEKRVVLITDETKCPVWFKIRVDRVEEPKRGAKR